VEEHLIFFARLKGVVDVAGAVRAKIAEIGLTEKRDVLAKNLSGGELVGAKKCRAPDYNLTCPHLVSPERDRETLPFKTNRLESRHFLSTQARSGSSRLRSRCSGTARWSS